MHTYTARIIGKNENPPPEAQHGSLRIGVFRVEDTQETQVGEYLRHFGSLTGTFCPFRLNDKDYALYSMHHDASRVMELPSCKDLGLSASGPYGFIIS